MNNVKKQRETKEWETRDLFKKIGDTKGNFYLRMGMKENINGKNLAEADKLRRGVKDTQITDMKCPNNLDDNDGVVW